MAESGSESETEICEVQTILARRKVEGEYEYLIRWKGFDSSEDSWEPEDHLIDCKDVLHEFLLSLNNAKIVHPKTPPPRSTKKSAKKNDMSTSTSKTTIQSTRETRQRKLQTPIHNGYFSTGKVTGSAKAVRRTLEMKPQQSFLHRHQWWICYFFILFIVSSVAAALAWRIYTHKPQQQNV
ncbi:uncharacterized protein LOC144438341 isoform X2 [Glandiceps talaboti]